MGAVRRPGPPLVRDLAVCVAIAVVLATGYVCSLPALRHAGLIGPASSRTTATASVPSVSAGNAGDSNRDLKPPAGGLQGAAVAQPANVYAGATGTTVSPALAGIPERVYVPDSMAASVDVIDPTTFQVIAHVSTGSVPYHITPSWDMRKLYVTNEASGSLSALDPASAGVTATVPVGHPYNLYFTPDGSRAVVVDERQRLLEFRDPNTWQSLGSASVPWPGVNHVDFSADGSYLLASCEFSGAVVKVDVVSMQVAGLAQVGGLPVDVRLAPDGSVFYVANQGRGGVSIIDPGDMREVGFINTGRGAHGFQLSRDAQSLYVSNRLEGTISVIDFQTRSVTGTWRVGGSPDMMQISPDGRQLWVSSRFERAVYVVDTASGALLRRIPVGSSPHGLAYFPNVGRFSLGHNGVYR